MLVTRPRPQRPTCREPFRGLPVARWHSAWLVAVLLGWGGAGAAQTLELSPAEILQRARPENKAPALPATPPGKAEAERAAETPKPARPATPETSSASAVAQAYLYLEPQQARFEVLYDAATALRLIDPALPAPRVLDAALRQRLAKEMATRAGAWCRLKTDGREAASSMAYPVLLTGKPGATQPVEGDQDLPLAGAMLGLAWSFELPPMPEQLAVAWQGHLSASGKLPVRVLYGPKSEPAEISRSSPGFTWRSLGRLPRPQPLAPVPGSVSATWRLPVGFLVWCLAGAGFAWSARRRRARLLGGWLLYAILWGAGAIVLWPRLMLPLAARGGPAVDSPEGAAAVLSPLLQNVYRAFDHRTESAIYDVLARSVEGNLLRRLYLETIEALSLEGRQGARVTIKEFSAEVDAVEPAEQGFMADCQWTALGTVGHWGHAHTRVNRYKARVTVTAVRGEWKLTGLEVLEARRL